MIHQTLVADCKCPLHLKQQLHQNDPKVVLVSYQHEEPEQHSKIQSTWQLVAAKIAKIPELISGTPTKTKHISIEINRFGRLTPHSFKQVIRNTVTPHIFNRNRLARHPNHLNSITKQSRRRGRFLSSFLEEERKRRKERRNANTPKRPRNLF